MFAVQEVPRRVQPVPGEVALRQLAPGADNMYLEMRRVDVEVSGNY